MGLPSVSKRPKGGRGGDGAALRADGSGLRALPGVVGAAASQAQDALGDGECCSEVGDAAGGGELPGVGVYDVGCGQPACQASSATCSTRVVWAMARQRLTHDITAASAISPSACLCHWNPSLLSVTSGMRLIGQLVACH